MHGFNNSVTYLSKLCEKNDFIFVQEHWLLKAFLCKFDVVIKTLCLMAVLQWIAYVAGLLAVSVFYIVKTCHLSFELLVIILKADV